MQYGLIKLTFPDQVGLITTPTITAKIYDANPITVSYSIIAKDLILTSMFLNSALIIQTDK